MTCELSGNTRRLPLHEKHKERGARFGCFGSWEVPLYYTSIVQEHQAVRNQAGIFDISHMGEFFVEGKAALEALDRLVPRAVRSVNPGSAAYSQLLNPEGGIIDDIILYCFSPEKFLLIVNAGNAAKDAAWIGSQLSGRKVFIKDVTEQMGLLALQGPCSQAVLQKAYPDLKLSGLLCYQFIPWQSGVIARTGYTGEDGFEVMADLKDLPEIWDRLFASGEEYGLVSAGFGSRDTLRLEAAMPLYGHDLSEETTPLEAGLGWSIDFSKNDFIGKAALSRQKEQGLKKKLVGFEMMDRGIPRQDYDILRNGNKIGKVTSGSFAPTLAKNIGMGYIQAEEGRVGNEIQISVRGNALAAKIVKLPFYRRTSEAL